MVTGHHNPIPAHTNGTENRREPPMCFRCEKQGHKQQRCWEQNVYCTKCQYNNHNTEACRRYPDPTTQTPLETGIAFHDDMYHPVGTPLMINPQPEPQSHNGLHIPRQQEPITPAYQAMSPAASNITDTLTQILTQVMQNKQEGTNKRLNKNIEIFDGTDKSKCIDWLIQVEAAAQFMNAPLKDIVLSQVLPAIYSILKGLLADTTDEDVKQLILSNFSDTGTTTEAASRLENLKMDKNEPLITFNARYEALHNIAFGFGPEMQSHKPLLTMYVSKLPYDTSKKLLKKLSKENSYIRTLKAAFKAALEINRETLFINASISQQEDHRRITKDTQINKLDDSFQDLDINYMTTRSNSQNSRCSYRSFNSPFNKSSRSYSQNCPGSYRSNYRQNNYQRYNNNNNHNAAHNHEHYNKNSSNSFNRFDNNQNKFNNRRPINKYKHYSNQPRQQIVFKYTQNSPMEMLDTLRNFINHMKRNPSSRPSMKMNKIAPRTTGDVNKNDIHTGSLEQVQKLVNEDSDLV